MKRIAPIAAPIALACALGLGACGNQATSQGSVQVTQEPTQTVTKSNVSVEIPLDWSVEYKDGSQTPTITPDDFDGMLIVGATVRPLSAFANAEDAFNHWLETDTFSDKSTAADLSTGDIPVRRYSIDLSGGKESKGFSQVALSGDEAVGVFFICAGTEYDEHAEEMEQVMDTIEVVDPEAPRFSSQAVPQPSESTPNTTNTAPSQDQSNGMTMSQANALESARSYISSMGFSHTGLIDQLEFEGYSTEDATFAADNCGADWNAEALEKAKNYIGSMGFSYTGLVDQLEFEGFTAEQATYGADNCGADWYAEAAEKAESYLNSMSFSHSGLVDQLIFEGFTADQAEYGVAQTGL